MSDSHAAVRHSGPGASLIPPTVTAGAPERSGVSERTGRGKGERVPVGGEDRGMTRTVEGVAAVLHRPMSGRPIAFGAPHRHLSMDDAPVVLDGVTVGRIVTMWLAGDQVHWTGRVELTREDLASRVGVPALTGAAMSERNRVTTLTGWRVSRMTLVPDHSRPWQDVTLRAW